MSAAFTDTDKDPRAAVAVERIMGAILEPMHEEIARRAGKVFSRRTGVPGVLAIGELSPVREFASLKHSAEAMEIIDSACSQCAEPLRCSRLTAGSCACEPCRNKTAASDQEKRHEKYWSQDHLCPPGSIFRATDKTHPNFPRAQYEATKDYSGGESLLLFGPTGTGKTRLAVHLGKRCLYRYNAYVGILWPEDLKQAARSYERRDEIARLYKFDLLIMDDALLTGAQDEKMADFLKDLLDQRLRNGRRHMIITSQIGSANYEEQLSKYAKISGKEITAADKRRVDALLRRIKEEFRVVSFADVTPSQGETSY